MQYVIHRFTLDLHKSGIQATIQGIKRGNAKGNILEISLMQSGVPYVLENCTVVFRAVASNGAKLYNSCGIDGNKVIYDLTTDTIASGGETECQLQIRDAQNTVLFSPRFCLEIEDEVYPDAVIEAKDEFTALTVETNKAAVQAEAAAVSAAAAAESAELAVAAADSAQSYKTSAETAKTAAETAASSAETAAEEAETNAESATTSAASAESAAETAAALAENVTDMHQEVMSAKAEMDETLELIEVKADVLELDSSTGKAVAVTDSADGRIAGLTVYGESSQDGTPSPESPVEIESVENPVVTVYAKNILPYPYDQTTHESSGVTFTDNGDGSITANGTSTDWAVYNLVSNFSMKAGTYYTAGTSSDRISIIAYDGSEWTTFAGYNVYQFTLTEDKVFQFVKVQLSSGFTYSNVQILPYIAVTPYTEYTPYTAPQTVTIPYTLRGIKDSDGGWAARDEIVVDGKQKTVKLIRRVGSEVYSGTESFEYTVGTYWHTDGVTTAFQHPIPSDALADPFGMFVVCNQLEYAKASGINKAQPYISGNVEKIIFAFLNTTASSIEELQAFLTEQPLEFIYTLAEPEVSDITDTEAGQALLALVTHYPNTTVVCDTDCALRYKADTTIAYNNLLSRVAALEAAAVGQM